MISTRRIRPGDARALVDFYNGRGESSRRTFRPLGTETTPHAAEEIARDNAPDTDAKFDLVALAELAEGTRIVGWGFLWKLDSEEPVFGLAVADEHQGRGLGGRLMGEVLAAARVRGKRKVGLTVVKDNAVARRLYEKHGFARGDEFVGDDGLTYLRMTADLEPGLPDV